MGSVNVVKFLSSQSNGLVGEAIKWVGNVVLKPLLVKKCLYKNSLLESISANILSEYKKDSVPAKGCHENLAGELIFEYVGVNITCSLLVSETEFQYK
tara:strand:- start:1126 stop:1419 length:294 start_codon:yes stop_codon:yes gene_type:complete